MNCRNLLFVSAVGLSALPLFASTRTLQKSIEKAGGKYPATWEAMNGVGYWAEAGSAEDKLEAGFDYVVPTGLQFSTPQATSGTLPFPGDSLEVMDTAVMIVRHYGNKVEFNGAGMTIKTKNGLQNYNGALGAKTRSSTQSYIGGKVVFGGVSESQINHANNVNVGETFDGEFVIEAGTTVKFVGAAKWDASNPGKNLDSRAKRNSVELLGDTSGVRGSINVGTNMYFVVGSNGLQNVTLVRLNGSPDCRPYAASIRPAANMPVATIDVKSLRFSGGAIETPVANGESACINVTGDLVIDDTVDVYISKTAGECSARTIYPILASTNRLYASDFNFVGAYDNVSPDDISFANPSELVVEEDESTGVFTLCLDVQPVVWCVQNSTYGNTGAENYFCQLTNAASWSDGQLPHADAHYMCNQKYLRGPLRDVEGELAGFYEFPGLSLTIGGSTSFYETYGEFRCADLRLLNGAALVLWNNFKRRISGRMTVNPDDAEGESRILIYQEREETITADIRGQGTLTIGGNVTSGSPLGSVVLAGDNSAFLGKFRFYTGVRTSDPVLPDWSRQFKVYVSAGRHLGGPLQESVFDAIAVEDYTKMFVTNNVEVAANRGLYVKLGAELCVSPNMTATFGSGVTVDGSLVKSGDGTLAIGGSFNTSGGGNAIEVREGALKPLTTTCVDGAALSFTAGTRLVYDLANGDGFSSVGIRFTKSGSSFVVSGGKVKVDICSSTGVMPADKKVRLFTGTVAQCATFLDSVEVGTCSVGRRRPELSVVTNGDGSGSVVADIEKRGIVLIFR